ncbi:30S ribosomal protein S7, partial [Candidatus Woesearchaeota archaeon]|nr:30S ribosomal protein S7 [Candidatus Woesearchaeota archaeon]
MVKVFNKWETEGIVVEDKGVKPYINLKPLIIPRTGGRNTGIQFSKTKNNIIERFMNKLQAPGHKAKKHYISSGHCCGKATKSYKIIEK